MTARPPKAPRGHGAEHTPPPLEGDEKVVWLAAFAHRCSSYGAADAHRTADNAVRALRAHRASETAASLYRGDAE